MDWLGSAKHESNDMTNRRHISPTARQRILSAQDNLCAICNEGADEFDGWELDHIVPLCLGGADEETNWQVVHRSCHARKSARDNSAKAKADRIARKAVGTWKKRGPKLRGRGFTAWRDFSGQIKRRS